MYEPPMVLSSCNSSSSLLQTPNSHVRSQIVIRKNAFWNDILVPSTIKSLFESKLLAGFKAAEIARTPSEASPWLLVLRLMMSISNWVCWSPHLVVPATLQPMNLYRRPWESVVSMVATMLTKFFKFILTLEMAFCRHLWRTQSWRRRRN